MVTTCGQDGRAALFLAEVARLLELEIINVQMKLSQKILRVMKIAAQPGICGLNGPIVAPLVVKEFNHVAEIIFVLKLTTKCKLEIVLRFYLPIHISHWATGAHVQNHAEVV